MRPSSKNFHIFSDNFLKFDQKLVTTSWFSSSSLNPLVGFSLRPPHIGVTIVHLTELKPRVTSTDCIAPISSFYLASCVLYHPRFFLANLEANWMKIQKLHINIRKTIFLVLFKAFVQHLIWRRALDLSQLSMISTTTIKRGPQCLICQFEASCSLSCPI